MGQPSILALPVIDIPQILSGECRKIKQESRCFKEDLDIAGPGMPLSGRAIGGHIQVVALGRPKSGIHQLVDQRVGAIEEANLFHVGIYRNSFKIDRIDFKVRFHQ